MTRSISLYVHWPFCKAKCPYCDFNSHVRPEVDRVAYGRALVTELQVMAEAYPGRVLESVFFGGGTPSLMPPESVRAVLEEAGRIWDVSPSCEVTLEANPTSVEAAKLAEMKAAGVNRVSMGIQALQAGDLRFLGREHSVGEAWEAWEVARGLFERASFDLIYARPGQGVAAWEAELREALQRTAGHVSVYQLTIEPATPFFHRHRRGDFRLPEEGDGALMFERTRAICAEAGMPAYEISNHATPGVNGAGQECRHNLVYWRGGDWLGIGPGAHGRMTECREGQVGRRAMVTERSPEAWLKRVQGQGHGIKTDEWEDAAGYAEERILMGMRLCEGIDAQDVAALVGGDVGAWLDSARVRMLQEEGLLWREGSRVGATEAGFLVLNGVIEVLAGEWL